MNSKEFDALLRKGESYHNLLLPPHTYIVVRIDGHGFSKFLESFEHPFDLRVNTAMTAAMCSVTQKFNGLYGYTESDEISILLPRDFQDFNRSLEKIVSLSAALATSSFCATLSANGACGSIVRDKLPHFDARVWLGATQQYVVDYFRWRQADSERNCLSSYAYWTLRQRGQMTGRAATRALHGAGPDQKHELLHSYGINFAKDVPTWEKNGTGCYFIEQEQGIKRPGMPIYTGDTVIRRSLKCDWELPYRDEYSYFIREMLFDESVGKP